MICVISFLIINWSTIHEKPEPKLLIDDQVNVINQETVFQDTTQIIDAPVTDQESIADEIKPEVIQQNGKIEIEIKAGDTLEELFILSLIHI